MAAPAAEGSDEDLAARAAAGDEPAFEALLCRYEARVYRLAFRLTGNQGDAQDILQEAFLAAYRGLSAFRRESRFSTWLYRIATNAALMHRRARMRRPFESLTAFLPRFDEDGVHAGAPADLRAASLDRLPSPYRAAFVLRDLEEMTTEEVAELLGLTAAAVRQRVHRARLMLRGYLSDLVGVKP
jgi:RNA polymerase sigma-70 factor, ECF subfamily